MKTKICTNKDRTTLEKMKVEILYTASNNGCKSINQNEAWIYGRIEGYHKIGEWEVKKNVREIWITTDIVYNKRKFRNQPHQEIPGV